MPVKADSNGDGRYGCHHKNLLQTSALSALRCLGSLLESRRANALRAHQYSKDIDYWHNPISFDHL
jgi:hypothetical protein